MASDSPRVRVALKKIRLEEIEDIVLIEQFIKVSQLRLELKLQLGDHLEVVYGIVAIDYHGGCCGPVGFLGIRILQDRPISHRKLILGHCNQGTYSTLVALPTDQYLLCQMVSVR
jgi:hypothetical protein